MGHNDYGTYKVRNMIMKNQIKLQHKLLYHNSVMLCNRSVAFCAICKHDMKLANIYTNYQLAYVYYNFSFVRACMHANLHGTDRWLPSE